MAKTISLSGTKEAALYFERVLPFDSIIGVIPSYKPESEFKGYAFSADCVPFDDKPLAMAVVRSLLPNVGDAHQLGLDLLFLQWGVVAIGKQVNISDKKGMQNLDELVTYIRDRFGKKIDIESVIKNPRSGEATFRKLLNERVAKLGFHQSSTWGGFGGEPTDAQKESSVRLETTIRGLNLIDVNKISWEEVLEFRKDKESWNALRDLRLFFTENFQNRDREYINDKLMQLIYKQESAARLWKFETVQKSLSVAFNSHSAIASSLSGLAAAYGGASLSLVAGAAMSFPIGSSILEFAKVFLESSKERIERPVRFLTKLRRISK